MRVTTAERLLLSITALAVLYRTLKDEWPVALEVDET